jgi:hypothetical protein
MNIASKKDIISTNTVHANTETLIEQGCNCFGTGSAKLNLPCMAFGFEL